MFQKYETHAKPISGKLENLVEKTSYIYNLGLARFRFRLIQSRSESQVWSCECAVSCFCEVLSCLLWNGSIRWIHISVAWKSGTSWDLLRWQDEDQKMRPKYTANDAWRHCGKSPQSQLNISSLERALVGNIRSIGPLLHSLVFQRCSLDSQPVGRRIWPITMHVSLEVDLCGSADTVTLFARRFLLLCTNCW